MMKQPVEKTCFQAGRDNRGAFATGAGANARNVEAGGVYIENYTESVVRRESQPSALLQSFMPEEYQTIVIDSHKYQVQTVDAALIEARRHIKTELEPNGTTKISESLQLFFQKDDGDVFDRLWHDVSFPCPIGGWLTFLIVVKNEREQINSFYVHGCPTFWLKWPHTGKGVGLPLSVRKACLLSFAVLSSGLMMVLSNYLKFRSDITFVIYMISIVLCVLVLKREYGRLNSAIGRAQQAVQFYRLQQ